MKLTIRLLTILLASTCQATFAENTLKLLNWEDYIADSVLAKWEAQSGYKVEQVYFDNDEDRDAILLFSANHNIDLAVVDEVIGERFGEQELLVELDNNNLPGKANYHPFWSQRCGHYAVPYLWGTLGIAYRTDKVSQPPTSWLDILQPNTALQGHVGMMEDYTDLLAPAFFYLGKSINSEAQEDLVAAFELLKAQAPSVLTYEYAITYVGSNEQADELYMALVYGGDQFTLNEQAHADQHWRYVIPSEGTVLWVDCLAIPTTSQNQEIALQFINFLSQPEIAAENAEALYYATPNRAAEPLLDPEFFHNQEVFLPKAVQDRSQLYSPLSEENIERRLRITNAIMNIHETRNSR
ncbi:spermidine/putrescine ABC transporter substrate-binding protein [Halioxenophilus sp. WMMB6]|uniref:polyamine ABC transporter substrate-binding protein n=1 Tax=Halioxenophilus sp. WMMB6 TaxID=3073815 RepID=UPI00295F0A87|nr:spermidine/putrescine ABC transporter substrate-binding protein [Halioxenophilus sp. WMMB6]